MTILWTPNELTVAAVRDFITTLLYRLPYLIGIDELLNDCEVVDMDPEGVGAGTYPRYITVTIKRYHQMVVYRGFPEIAVGDIVTVAHFRQGDLYEIVGIGGASGEVLFPIERLSDYCRGCIIRGGATEWETHFAGGNGYAITGDGTDVFSTAIPYWSDRHSWQDGISPVYAYIDPTDPRTYFSSDVGIGTQTTANAQLTVADTSQPQLRLEYPQLYPGYVHFTVSSAGNLTISPSGSYVLIDEDLHLDAGVGDSPILKLITGNDGAIWMWADEGLYAADTDLVVRMADYSGGSRFIIRETGYLNADVAWIDSAGNAWLSGAAVSISPSYSSYNSQGLLCVAQTLLVSGKTTVIYIRQHDKSESFMHLHGESVDNFPTGNLVEAEDFDEASLTGYFLVRITDDRSGGLDGVEYWVPLYHPIS